MRDWDDAFANMAYVEGAETLPEIWASRAVAYREGLSALEKDIHYGASERERFDLIWPDGEARGLAVFVHGGYWLKFDKSYWTNLAEGARANGFAVCLPSYTLAPEARISEITVQITAAVEAASARVAGPIHLAGHSAGGHLVTRMVCRDTQLSTTVLARISHVLSISGVHDLRPLLKTQMNEGLRLDMAEATSESPVLHRPDRTPRLTVWVGGDERPEFIRQSRLFAMMWDGLGSDVKLQIDGAHNHFSVIEDLCSADSAITRAFVGT